MKGITLKRLNIRRDLSRLFDMMCTDEQYLFSSKIICHTQEQFSGWLSEKLNTNFHDFYLIALENETAGFVHNYDFSLLDGHCKMTVYVEKPYREIGIGGMAGFQFMQLMFSQYPLRKIYTTVYDYNIGSLENNLKAGFQKEGCLNEYKYFDKGYHGLHYLSMTRKDFEERWGVIE